MEDSAAEVTDDDRVLDLTPPDSGGEVDWKARYEQAQAELTRERARVKAANRKLSDVRALVDIALTDYDDA